jgi:hypothetical protein
MVRMTASVMMIILTRLMFAPLDPRGGKRSLAKLHFIGAKNELSTFGGV